MISTCSPYGLVVHVQFWSRPHPRETGNGRGPKILLSLLLPNHSTRKLMMVSNCSRYCLVVHVQFWSPTPPQGGGAGNGRGPKTCYCFSSQKKTHARKLIMVSTCSQYGLVVQVQFWARPHPMGSGEMGVVMKSCHRFFIKTTHVRELRMVSTCSPYVLVVHVQFCSWPHPWGAGNGCGPWVI